MEFAFDFPYEWEVQRVRRLQGMNRYGTDEWYKWMKIRKTDWVSPRRLWVAGKRLKSAPQNVYYFNDYFITDWHDQHGVGEQWKTNETIEDWLNKN